MSTPKEIFLELLRPDGQPERQLRQYEALSMLYRPHQRLSARQPQARLDER